MTPRAKESSSFSTLPKEVLRYILDQFGGEERKIAEKVLCMTHSALHQRFKDIRKDTNLITDESLALAKQLPHFYNSTKLICAVWNENNVEDRFLPIDLLKWITLKPSHYAANGENKLTRHRTSILIAYPDSTEEIVRIYKSFCALREHHDLIIVVKKSAIDFYQDLIKKLPQTDSIHLIGLDENIYPRNEEARYSAYLIKLVLSLFAPRKKNEIGLSMNSFITHGFNAGYAHRTYGYRYLFIDLLKQLFGNQLDINRARAWVGFANDSMIDNIHLGVEVLELLVSLHKQLTWYGESEKALKISQCASYLYLCQSATDTITMQQLDSELCAIKPCLKSLPRYRDHKGVLENFEKLLPRLCFAPQTSNDTVSTSYSPPRFQR